MFSDWLLTLCLTLVASAGLGPKISNGELGLNSTVTRENSSWAILEGENSTTSLVSKNITDVRRGSATIYDDNGTTSVRAPNSNDADLDIFNELYNPRLFNFTHLGRISPGVTARNLSRAHFASNPPNASTVAHYRDKHHHLHDTERYSVVMLDFQSVQVPFYVCLCLISACLAKTGEAIIQSSFFIGFANVW